MPAFDLPRIDASERSHGHSCKIAHPTVEYFIKQYDLEQGSLEIQYIEEFFGEFPRKKMAAEIVRRLSGRAHLILLATASLPDDPGTVVPVAFKVAHEIRQDETEPKLVDLVGRLDGSVQFEDRRVLYTWIGGTRRDWRGQGHFRALTEQQEFWAIDHGFDEIVVKTKNRFYEMRGTLDHLHFEVVKYERNADRQRRIEGLSQQEARSRAPASPPRQPHGRSGRGLTVAEPIDIEDCQFDSLSMSVRSRARLRRSSARSSRSRRSS